jgi:hypothetical protein
LISAERALHFLLEFESNFHHENSLLLSPILARRAPRPENIVQENDLLRFWHIGLFVCIFHFLRAKARCGHGPHCPADFMAPYLRLCLAASNAALI